jgi:hypothetical protein
MKVGLIRACRLLELGPWPGEVCRGLSSGRAKTRARTAGQKAHLVASIVIGAIRVSQRNDRARLRHQGCAVILLWIGCRAPWTQLKK